MIDVIVIGAGAAGMTAALYVLRAGKTALVLEKETFGGQIAIAPLVENFPSVKQISGAEFSEKLTEQIIELGAEIEVEDVENVVRLDNGLFQVKTNYNTYQSKSVIIATGVEHKKVGVQGEEDLVGKGVSYCAVCDGAFYKGKSVAVLGSGNAALQYSILMSSYCKQVYLCTRRNVFSGEHQLAESLSKFPNIIVKHNVTLNEFLVEDDKLVGLKFLGTQDKQESIIEVQGCFVAIGHKPNNEAFRDFVQLDEHGYIVANEDCKTSQKGVFVAGDCRTKSIRQLTTAVGDGTVAGMASCAYIDSL